jgi:hypothetical protein
MNSDRPVQLP